MKTTSSKSKPKAQFIVLTGDLDGSPEDVSVAGIFPTRKAAQKFAREEYLANHPMDDEDENPDLDFTDFVDDGHTFWRIAEVPLPRKVIKAVRPADCYTAMRMQDGG
jgi:hypothetical protein